MPAADCGVKSAIRVNETIRCKECGHRVMYKPRTHRSELHLSATRRSKTDDRVVVGGSTAIRETKMQDSADHIYRSNSKLVSHILLPQFGLFQVLQTCTVSSYPYTSHLAIWKSTCKMAYRWHTVIRVQTRSTSDTPL